MNVTFLTNNSVREICLAPWYARHAYDWMVAKLLDFEAQHKPHDAEANFDNHVWPMAKHRIMHTINELGRIVCLFPLN